MNTDKTQPAVASVVVDVATLGTTQTAEQPVRMEIVSNKTGHGIGLVMTLVGKDSRAYRALNRQLQNARLDELSRTRKLKMTAEQNEAETLRLLAECVVSWESRLMKRDTDNVLVPLLDEKGNEQFEPTLNLLGEKLECNKENVKKVFRMVPEIREQVEDFLADRSNFVTESQQS